jgi:Fe-Mn family superoxide dismutase
MHRRSFLSLAAAAGSVALAAPAVRAQAQTAAPAAPAGAPTGPFTQPPLPFEDTALAPVIGQRTVQLHYGMHHAGQYATLNRLVQGKVYASMPLVEVVRRSSLIPEDQAILNNGGQAYNHDLYWEQFKPGGARAPAGNLLAKIDSDLGGVDKFKTDFVTAAGAQFGSGWAWLVHNPDGKLAIVTTPNGNNPIGRNQIPLLGVDVWEHAYYLDWENRRTDHVRAVLDQIVNWDVVAGRMRA